LGSGDSRLVAEHWPYNDNKNDLRYINWRIKTGPTAAIRRQGRLVAWALTHGDGSMGFLHVLKPWRGQGMARTIGTALAQRLLGKGIGPFLFIEKKNRASIRLTRTMGFERVGTFAWFSARPASKPVRRT
jgi:8-oxo-dGTP diphosphatase